jgi:hypothetical protein
MAVWISQGCIERSSGIDESAYDVVPGSGLVPAAQEIFCWNGVRHLECIIILRYIAANIHELQALPI